MFSNISHFYQFFSKLNILLTPSVYEHAYACKKMSKMYTDEAGKAITQLATGGG